MKCEKLYLDGAYQLFPEKIQDNRGFFASLFTEDEFVKLGLCLYYPQFNLSYNYSKGTLRGMHFQLPPYEQVKLVQCVRGEIYDVIVDLRKDSKTYCGWYGTFLTDAESNMLYVPEGFAHGYITMTPDSEVLYHISEQYQKDFDSGVKFDDPAFSIVWPSSPKVISERDLNHPRYIK